MTDGRRWHSRISKFAWYSLTDWLTDWILWAFESDRRGWILHRRQMIASIYYSIWFLFIEIVCGVCKRVFGSWIEEREQKARKDAHTHTHTQKASQKMQLNENRILRSFTFDLTHDGPHTIQSSPYGAYTTCVRRCNGYASLFFGNFRTITLNELTIFSRFLWQLPFGIILLLINAHDDVRPHHVRYPCLRVRPRFATRMQNDDKATHSLRQRVDQKQTIILFSSLSFSVHALQHSTCR